MRQIIAMVIVACAAASTSAAHADPYNDIVIVPPAKLPEAARQSGDAMLLRETNDGRKLLFIERENGSELATLDVTDPVHVKAQGSVQLDASGAFDFVSPLGKRSELIRFRQGQTDAVLDFHKDETPYLETAPGLMLPGSTSAADQPSPSAPAVRKEVANADTGTTFVLTQNGLYLIRRPAVELDRKRRAQEWFEEHAAG